MQGEGLSSFPSCAPGLSWPLPQPGLAQLAPLTPPVSEFSFQSLFLTLPRERAQTPRSHTQKPLGAAAGGERGAHTSPTLAALNKRGAASPSQHPQLQLPVLNPQITQPCAICGVYTFPCSCFPHCCTPCAVPCGCPLSPGGAGTLRQEPGAAPLPALSPPRRGLSAWIRTSRTGF